LLFWSDGGRRRRRRRRRSWREKFGANGEEKKERKKGRNKYAARSILVHWRRRLGREKKTRWRGMGGNVALRNNYGENNMLEPVFKSGISMEFGAITVIMPQPRRGPTLIKRENFRHNKKLAVLALASSYQVGLNLRYECTVYEAGRVNRP
jgi:hypothetical protein